jgi:phage terminase large subunit GpA-like protein
MAVTKSRRRKEKRLEPEVRSLIRRGLRPPRRQRVSAWADENRILGGEESAFPGRWRTWRVPYLEEVMDAFSDREVEVIVCVFAAQCGKTEAELNALGYIIDQDPGPTLIVYPGEKQSDKVMRTRIHPMILNSPAVRSHVVGNSDDLGLKEIRLDRMRVYAAWSNSPAALASSPCRYVILDEVDKFPAYAGREANPIQLASVRTRTFGGRRKIFITSTPTLDSGYIWSEWERSDQNHFWVPCPACGTYQVLDFSRVKWPEGARADDIRRGELAWYECSSERCKARIEDSQKMEMVSKGRWVPRNVVIDAQGELVGKAPPRTQRGFQLSVLYSPWVSFSECAAEFLKSLGNASLLMNFHNSWLGLPWREKIESVTEAKIRAARRDYGAGAAPAGGKVLTAGVDVQADCFWYAIRAWGPEERSWLVRYGAVFSWEELWEVLSARYRVGNEELTVERAMVDSGFRTSEVYQFCREHRPVTFPSKGSNNPALVASVRLGHPEMATILFTFKADSFKDRLSGFIGRKPGEPGEWCIPRDITEDYIRQMTSERRVIVRKKGRPFSTWEPITESTPNHLWDCEVLNTLAADQIQVRYLDPGAPQGGGGPPPGPRAKGESDWLRGEKGEGWFEKGSIWDAG